MTQIKGLDVPKGLSRKGRAAAYAIRKVLADFGMEDTGGCRTFYTPKEWDERGEAYGHKSLLVVVYDGGDLYNFLSYNTDFGKGRDAMAEALANVGVYAESCTGWYSAIYE